MEDLKAPRRVRFEDPLAAGSARRATTTSTSGRKRRKGVLVPLRPLEDTGVRTSAPVPRRPR